MIIRVNNDDSLTAIFDSDQGIQAITASPCQLFGEGAIFDLPDALISVDRTFLFSTNDDREHREADVSIKKVIFNDPATIVYWNDGSKTVVKCTEDDVWDPEKGLAMAICKHIYGADFHKIFNKYIPEDQKDVESLYPSLPVLMDGLRKAVEKATHIIKEEK